MPQAQLATQHLGKSLKGLPYAALQNVRLYKRDDGKICHLATSGVANFANVGTGTNGIRGLFQMDGVLGSDLIAVTKTNVYRVTSAGVASNLGSISANNNKVRIANSVTETCIVSDDKAYQVLSSGVNQILDPDLPSVSDVIYASGVFVFAKKDTDRIYWSDVLNVTSIGSASFATAETKPDRIRGLATMGEDIVLLGHETIEVWGKTGDITLPFQLRAGATYSTGCASRDSIVSFGDSTVGNRVAWLSNDKLIRAATVTDSQILSHNALNQELEQLTQAELEAVNCFAWCEEGTWFLCVQLPNTTWVYDVNLGLWHSRNALNGTWPISCVTEAWGNQIAGCSKLDLLGKIEPYERATFGERIKRIGTAFIPLDIGYSPINSTTIRLSMGLDDDVATEKFLWLDWSDDRGNTWNSKRKISLGFQGNYRYSVTYSPCGSTRNAGRVVRYEIADPYQLTLGDILYNEVAA